MSKQKKYEGEFLFFLKEKTLLAYRPSSLVPTLRIATGKDGEQFVSSKKSVEIILPKKKSGTWKQTSEFRVTTEEKKIVLSFLRTKASGSVLTIATSTNGFSWKTVTETPFQFPGVVIENTEKKGSFLAYTATKRKFIGLAISGDTDQWERYGVVLIPREHRFDAVALSPFYAERTRQGILILYTARNAQGNVTLGAALFDNKHPDQLLWRSASPLWEAPSSWKRHSVRLFGGINRAKTFLVYVERDGEIAMFAVPKTWENILKKTVKPSPKETSKKRSIHTIPTLERHHENPILEPREGSVWESFAAFNPAVVQINGIIHFLYRAQGASGLSVLGYAVSPDGYRIEQRHRHPAYIPRESFESGFGDIHPDAAYSKYMSGGGYGGCEDPKATIIDDRVYLTYVAYDGWSPPRIAFSWIPIDDFLKHRWEKWSKPILLSPPGVVDKSAAILPEKIDGKYVIFHRIFPNILIDFVDSLDAFDGKTKFLRGEYKIPPRKDSWDRAKLSVGAPPIKTDRGWLIIYNAVTGLQEEPGSDTRYKIGAMLLDLKDPRKVIARSREPLLEPETEYENNGHKYGIVYPCGSAIKDGTLFVYYGASDKTVAVATAPLDAFLAALIADQPTPLTKITLK